jgi:hypothetical protein
MTTNQRRDLHRAINALTPDQVAAIVRRTHPRVRGNQVDTIAKPQHRNTRAHTSNRRVGFVVYMPGENYDRQKSTIPSMFNVPCLFDSLGHTGCRLLWVPRFLA